MSIVWQPLTATAFADFGDVIEAGGGEVVSINDGTTVRHNDLARIDVTEEGGRPLLSIFESRPFDFPFEMRMLERHPLGSQAFIPLDGIPFLVAVAPIGETINPADVRFFRADGAQGVNFHRGVWHHPVIVIQPMRFLVVDRGGEQENCDFSHLPPDGPQLLIDLPEEAGASSGDC